MIRRGKPAWRWRLDLPAEARLEKIGEGRGISAARAQRRRRNAGKSSCGPTTWPPRGSPLRACGFATHKSSISDQVRQGLERRIEDLGARVAALGTPQPINVMENSGFEASAEGEQIAGWSTEIGAGGTAAVDALQRHNGKHSLKLTSGGQPVAITSAPFDPPATGRLAVEVWLRTAEAVRQPSLRIAVEGQLRDGKFDPYGVIPAVGASAKAPGEWMRYSFPLDHLPADGLANLRAKFELTSAGDVWIDDVQVFDLAFSETERKELVKLLSLASLSLERGQVSDCAIAGRLLAPVFGRQCAAGPHAVGRTAAGATRRRVRAGSRVEEDRAREPKGLSAEIAALRVCCQPVSPAATSTSDRRADESADGRPIARRPGRS